MTPDETLKDRLEAALDSPHETGWPRSTMSLIWPLIAAHLATLQSAHDTFWRECGRGWIIETREWFEANYQSHGFSDPITMAMHHMWKRDRNDADAKLGATVREELTKRSHLIQERFWDGDDAAEAHDLLIMFAAIDASPTPEPTQEKSRGL